MAVADRRVPRSSRDSGRAAKCAHVIALVAVLACLAAHVAASSIVAPAAEQSANFIDFAVTLDASTSGLVADDFVVVADDRVNVTRDLTGSGTSFTLRVTLALVSPCPSGYTRSADGLYCGRLHATPGSWAAQLDACGPLALATVSDDARDAFVTSLVPPERPSAWCVRTPGI